MRKISTLLLTGLAGLLLLGLAGRASAADIPRDGLYFTQIYMSGSLTVGAMYFKAGQVIHDPVDSVDFDELRRNPSWQGDVGRYTVTGNHMTIVWANGSKTDAPLEPDASGGCFAWDATTMCPANAFKPGDTLTGKFENSRSLLRHMPDGVSGAIMKTLTFGPDNTYSQVGSWSFETRRENAPAVDVTGSGDGPEEKGTIRLEDNWITFQKAGNGTPKRLLAIPVTVYDGKRGTPDHLYLGARWYIRAQ